MLSVEAWGDLTSARCTSTVLAGRKGENHFSPVCLSSSPSSHFPGQRRVPCTSVSQPPASSIVTHSHTAPGTRTFPHRTQPLVTPHPSALAPSWWLFALSRISCTSRKGCSAASALVPLHLAPLYPPFLFFLSSFLLCCSSFPSIYFFTTLFKRILSFSTSCGF